jgi:RNA polymerase sigma factor (sigma-70 family)
MDDRALLENYARHGDEDSFRELVQRHLGLVYAAALRQVGGDAQFAQDVAQTVFADLAKKAASLTGHPVITGWLYTSTRFAASKLVRRERLRLAREEKANAMQEILGQGSATPGWENIRPVLDEALMELRTIDREAVLLRFFEDEGYGKMGAKLGISEDAARMRVDRAVGQLRVRLAQRGVTSTSAALTLVLSNHGALAAPSGLATVVASWALASPTSVGSVAATFMSITKLQLGIAGVLALAGTTEIALQARSQTALQQELAQLQAESADPEIVRAQNARIAQTIAEAAELRRDDAALQQLGEEADGLKRRLAALERAPTNESEKMGTLDGAPVFEIAKADLKPKATIPPKPIYPEELKRLGVAGNVTLDFIIDAEGDVRNATVVSSTQSECEGPAMEAMKKAKYSPAGIAGQPVNVHLQITIRFTTDKSESRRGTP